MYFEFKKSALTYAKKMAYENAAAFTEFQNFLIAFKFFFSFCRLHNKNITISKKTHRVKINMRHGNT